MSDGDVQALVVDNGSGMCKVSHYYEQQQMHLHLTNKYLNSTGRPTSQSVHGRVHSIPHLNSFFFDLFFSRPVSLVMMLPALCSPLSSVALATKSVNTSQRTRHANPARHQAQRVACKRSCVLTLNSFSSAAAVGCWLVIRV